MFRIKYLLIWFIILFLCFSNNTFALEARIVIENKKIDINDYLKLRLELESDKWWEIWITEIKWLEDFEVIWKSQSQSSSSNVVIVNWETKSKTKTVHYLDLSLKAKNKWEFTIWPAEVINWNERKQTNKIKVSVTWNRLFVNDNHLPIWTKNINNNINKSDDNNQDNNAEDNTNDEIDDFENNIVKKDFKSSNKTLYILLLLVSIFWLIIYFVLKNKPELLEELKNNFDNKYKDKNNIKKHDINKHDKNKVDFEEKSKFKINYPNINDENFISEINEILKQKLYNKYKIENIENKTYENIINNLKRNLEGIDELNNIIKLINELKYSNYIANRSLLLELIKNYN